MTDPFSFGGPGTLPGPPCGIVENADDSKGVKNWGESGAENSRDSGKGKMMPTANEANERARGPVERAIGEIRKLAEREIELVREKQVKTRELSEAEHGAGLAYLENKTTNLDQIIKLQAVLNMTKNALQACRAQRLAAIESKFRTDAQETRRRAAKKQSELADLEAKTNRLLADLSSLEGMTFTQAILACQPASDPLQPRPVPKSALLRTEISELSWRAVELESKKIPNSGTVDVEAATSLDELLFAVLTHESEGPTGQEVLGWTDACQASALKRGGVNAQFGDLARRYRLCWTDGKIDLAASYVFVAALKPDRVSALHGPESTVAAATFRAASLRA